MDARDAILRKLAELDRAQLDYASRALAIYQVCQSEGREPTEHERAQVDALLDDLAELRVIRRRAEAEYEQLI